MSLKNLCLLFFCIWGLWSIKLWLDSFGDTIQHELVFCDVGQGDAILIRDGDFEILVDGGPDDQVISCLRDHLPYGDRVVELVVLTHPDADHFTGLTRVLQTYQVQTLWANNIGKSSADYYDFYTAVMDQVEQSGLEVMAPALGEFYCVTNQVCVQVVSNFRDFLPYSIFRKRQSFGNLKALFSKFVQSSYNYNDGSIVINLYFDDISVLLTGDAESGQELAMIADGLLTDIDVLKIGHHGSKTSSSPRFLQILRPEIGIVSCGRNNSFGHPHAVTLQSARDFEVSLLRTDLLGEIGYVCAQTGECRWKTEREPP